MASALPDTTQRMVKAARKAPVSTVDAATRLLTVVGKHRDRADFVDRILELLADVTDYSATLETVTSSPEALLQLLKSPEVLASLRQHDPLAPARLRGLHVQAQILQAEGGTCSAEELGRMLGITRQGVDKRRKRGALIAFDLGKRGYAYPVWQVGIEGLEQVLADFGKDSGWGQAAFMLSPNAFLDEETPVDMLRKGEVERVREAASQYGNQVAI